MFKLDFQEKEEDSKEDEDEDDVEPLDEENGEDLSEEGRGRKRRNHQNIQVRNIRDLINLNQLLFLGSLEEDTKIYMYIVKSKSISFPQI